MVPASCCKRPLKEPWVLLLLCSKGSILSGGSQSLPVFAASFNVAHCHLILVLIILLLWLAKLALYVLTAAAVFEFALSGIVSVNGADKSKD